MTDCLTIWTIYQRPSDYPDSWVLRGHDILGEQAQPHRVCFVCRTLDEVRAKVPPGARRIGREPEDHPTIYETWVASEDIGEVAALTGTGRICRSRALAPGPALRRVAERARRNRSAETSGRNTALVTTGTHAEVASGGKRGNSKLTAREALYLEAKLAMASRHVVEGELRVGKIGAIIDRRRGFGLNTEFTENLLHTMLVTLSLMIDSRMRIEAELRSLARNERPEAPPPREHGPSAAPGHRDHPSRA